jgi:hypothetical protein
MKLPVLKPFTAVVVIVITALTACAGGSDSSSSSPPAAPQQPVGLLDESAKVEIVQGQDPRKYFIANRPALNAVDADNDGLWDDVQARLAAADIVSRVDPRVVSQLVRSFQDRLVMKTVAEAKANPNGYAYARACYLYLARAKGTPEGLVEKDWRELLTAVQAAVFASKERVLASEYADGMSSGGRFSQAPVNEASCR